jgi:hypothetical protein
MVVKEIHSSLKNPPPVLARHAKQDFGFGIDSNVISQSGFAGEGRAGAGFEDTDGWVEIAELTRFHDELLWLMLVSDWLLLLLSNKMDKTTQPKIT